MKAEAEVKAKEEAEAKTKAESEAKAKEEAVKSSKKERNDIAALKSGDSKGIGFLLPSLFWSSCLSRKSQKNNKDREGNIW